MVNLTSVFQMIKEMQRKFKAREAEKKELEVWQYYIIHNYVIVYGIML